MEPLDELTMADQADLLEALPDYQRKMIYQLLKTDAPLSVADAWLTAEYSNISGFGGTKGSPRLFREAVMDELEKFICGDKKYNEDRKHIGNGIKIALGAISSAIGASLGVAGPYLMPVIVLIILSAGKMSANAWCAAKGK